MEGRALVVQGLQPQLVAPDTIPPFRVMSHPLLPDLTVDGHGGGIVADSWYVLVTATATLVA